MIRSSAQFDQLSMIRSQALTITFLAYSHTAAAALGLLPEGQLYALFPTNEPN
jgi:hypothetical protein